MEAKPQTTAEKRAAGGLLNAAMQYALKAHERSRRPAWVYRAASGAVCEEGMTLLGRTLKTLDGDFVFDPITTGAGA